MSRFELSLLDETIDDIDFGRAFYELQEIGVGAYFKDSVFAELLSLGIYAGIHGVRFGYHRLLMKRFPFAIYYSFDGKVAEVIGVLDTRQDPRSIREALAQRANKSE